MARLNAGMDRISGRRTNLLLLHHARTWLRHLLNDSDYRDRVYASACHREFNFYRRRPAPRNFSHHTGSHRIRRRQRYQLHPNQDCNRSSWPASTSDQCSHAILHANSPNATSQNADVAHLTSATLPARYGSADRQRPTACAPGSHRFHQPSSKSEACRPTSLPTQLSRPPGLDPTAPRPHRAMLSRQQAMPCRVPRYSPEIPLEENFNKKSPILRCNNAFEELDGYACASASCMAPALPSRPSLRTSSRPSSRAPSRTFSGESSVHQQTASPLARAGLKTAINVVHA